MRIVTASQVEALLPMADCIALMREAMIAVSRGETVLPLRQFIPVPDTPGKLAVMPGAIAEPACFGIKLVSKFPGSAGGSHVGGVMLFDSRDGQLLALIEGGTLTAIRTAAASAMVTGLLANAGASTLLVTGAGEQAQRHIQSIRLVRPIERVLVWARDRDKARAVAARHGAETIDDLREAARGADIICTTTAAPKPYFKGEWLRPGQHLNLVGAAVATSAEVDSATVHRARVFVDYHPAAEAAAGELIDAEALDDIVAEIGKVADGRAAGRTSPEDITLYKSLGVTAQDLFAAHTVWRAAETANIGTLVDLEG